MAKRSKGLLKYPDVMTFRLRRDQKLKLDHIRAQTGVPTGVLMRRAVDWIIAEETLKLLDEITVLYAGGIAEKRFSGKWNNIGAKTDRGMAADMALRFCGDEKERDLLVAWLWQRTENMVTCKWRYIEVLAQELLSCKTIKSKQVKEIMRAETQVAMQRSAKSRAKRR